MKLDAPTAQAITSLRSDDRWDIFVTALESWMGELADGADAAKTPQEAFRITSQRYGIRQLLKAIEQAPATLAEFRGNR